MTVYEIKNTTAVEKAGGRSYLIRANEGFMIHLPEHTEYEYKPVVILLKDYNFEKVQVCAVEDIPADPLAEEVYDG